MWAIMDTPVAVGTFGKSFFLPVTVHRVQKYRASSLSELCRRCDLASSHAQLSTHYLCFSCFPPACTNDMDWHGFSNMASDWLAAVLPADQKAGLETHRLPGEYPHKGPVYRTFNALFLVGLSKLHEKTVQLPVIWDHDAHVTSPECCTETIE